MLLTVTIALNESKTMSNFDKIKSMCIEIDFISRFHMLVSSWQPFFITKHLQTLQASDKCTTRVVSTNTTTNKVMYLSNKLTTQFCTTESNKVSPEV